MSTNVSCGVENYLEEIGKLPKSLTFSTCSAEEGGFMRKNYIGFKVTEQENNIIQCKAQKAKTSVSAYVRSCAVNKPITVIDGLRELLPELKKIGNNLNQLTTIMWKNNIDNPDFKIIKEMYKQFFEKASEVLERGNYKNG